MIFRLLLICVCLAPWFSVRAQAPDASLATEDFRIRDPFILADEPSGTYYLYAQSKNRAKSDYNGVEVYSSRDLQRWTAPTPALVLPKSMKIVSVWAPEVFHYNNAYYLFVTLTFKEKIDKPAPVADANWPPLLRRGTWCFRASSPTGPFEPVKNDSLTPPNQLALDGTLWVEDGVPYMVFCHEWVELIDGTIDAVRLRPDLSDVDGEPTTILAGSSAPGAPAEATVGKVTDGPFLYKSPKSGALYLIWSTILPKNGGYSVLVARSASGKLAGPWSESTPLFLGDGGHGMIFRSFDGTLRLALHQPNGGAGKERLHTFELLDDGQTLRCREREDK